MNLFLRRKAVKPYNKKGSLMNELEREFYDCLCKLLCGTEYIVQPKVCLSSVIEGAHGAILNEIADFCVFDAEYKPLLIIEIDDEEYGIIFRVRKKGKRLRAALETAGLPCVKLWTNYGVHEEYIVENLREYLQFSQ